MESPVGQLRLQTLARLLQRCEATHSAVAAVPLHPACRQLLLGGGPVRIARPAQTPLVGQLQELIEGL